MRSRQRILRGSQGPPRTSEYSSARVSAVKATERPLRQRRERHFLNGLPSQREPLSRGLLETCRRRPQVAPRAGGCECAAESQCGQLARTANPPARLCHKLPRLSRALSTAAGNTPERSNAICSASVSSSEVDQISLEPDFDDSRKLRSHRNAGLKLRLHDSGLWSVAQATGSAGSCSDLGDSVS